MNHSYKYPDDGIVDMVGELCLKNNIKPLVSTGGGGIHYLAKKLGVDYRHLLELMYLDSISPMEDKSGILVEWTARSKEQVVLGRKDDSYF